MKFIKVTALAAAMMTTFGAQAELTAMDDAALEAVSGQKSITITLVNDATEGNILTTDFAYDDTDGLAGAGASGALILANTAIAGTGGAGTDELTVTLDVTGDGVVGGIGDALHIGISGLSIAGTELRIGASGGAGGDATDFTGLAFGRTAMTFNGTMSIAVGAE